MSQLDSIILQLQKVLAEKGGETPSIPSSESTDNAVDTVAAKRALSSFLSRAPESFEGVESSGLSDPAVIEAMRKSLVAFIDSPLRNGGTALMSGVISPDHVKQGEPAKERVHGHASSDDDAPSLNPFTPAPGNEFSWTPPCKVCIERKATGETVKPSDDEEASRPVNNKFPGAAPLRESGSPPPNVSSGYGGGASTAINFGGGSASAPVNPSSTRTATIETEPPAPAARASSMSPVHALLNVFGGRSNKAQKTPEVVAPKRVIPSSDPSGLRSDKVESIGLSGDDVSSPVPTTTDAQSPAPAPELVAPATVSASSTVSSPAKVNNNNSVLWFKHIQSVEAALRISDVHFATVLVALLFEVATAVEAPPNITARLKTFEARISMEFNKLQEAEEHLLMTIRELDETPFASNVTAAWCWHSLAQCYYRQGKHDQSKDAQQKAIAIATASLGAKDPETMLFHEPIG